MIDEYNVLMTTCWWQDRMAFFSDAVLNKTPEHMNTKDGQSPYPSPGIQLTGGNRQIRNTVPPLARGVTPVSV